MKNNIRNVRILKPGELSDHVFRIQSTRWMRVAAVGFEQAYASTAGLYATKKTGSLQSKLSSNMEKCGKKSGF